jgi:general nucleoside transport system permease protein
MKTQNELAGSSAVELIRFRYRLKKVQTDSRSYWWVPIVSVVMALLFCSIFILMKGLNPFNVYAQMAIGAFGSPFGVSETLVKTIPLLLCGVGVAIAYRINIWNIGAEGQFAAGAIAATAVTIYIPGLPGILTIPVMFLAGAAAGALWGMLTALPRMLFQVNEIITSLMLNYIALTLIDYFVFGPWKNPNGFNFPGTVNFTPAQQLYSFAGSRVHMGLVFAIAAVLVYAFLIYRTRWGYELKVLGANPEAARYAGINITKHVLIVMLISGGLAGIAGMSEVSGVAHRLLYGISPGYGYTAIIVAWLAKLNPFGMIVSSFLFGGLIVGGYSVQSIGLPPEVSLMVQGAIMFCLIGGETLARYRLVRRKGGI